MPIRLSDRQLAFVLLRGTLAMSFLVHGAVRLPKLDAFARGMAQGFADTPLPEPLVRVFATGLPFVELSLGVALLIGRTRLAGIVGSLLLAALIFGSGLKEDWDVVGTQMIYVLAFYALNRDRAHDAWTLGAR